MALYYEREVHRKERPDATQRIRVWDWKQNQVLHDEVAPLQMAKYPAISPDERFVTFGLEHGHVRYTLRINGDDISFDTSTDFESTSRVRGPLTFSPDSKLAATSVKSKDFIAAILDVQTGRIISKVDPTTAAASNQGHEYGCRVGFSPNGTQIVVADHTGRAALRNVDDGKVISELEQFQKIGSNLVPVWRSASKVTSSLADNQMISV